jgi:hypothetical protein
MKINLITLVNQLIGQIVLGLICVALLYLPDAVLGFVMVIAFVAAWFGGQIVGEKTLSTFGRGEASRAITNISFMWFRKTLPGTLIAFLVGVAAVTVLFGGHAALALVWVNVCLTTCVFTYWLTVMNAD